MTSPSTANRRSAVRTVALFSIVMLLLGVAAGVVWPLLAHPAQWEVQAGGLILTEAASKGQFSVIVVFVIIGAIVSLIWGAATGWVLRDRGWTLVPLVVLATLAAAVIAWRLGVALGPPDPTSVASGAIGEKIPAQLTIDAVAPFIVWPVFGLLGMLGAIWSDRSSAEPEHA